MILSLKRYFFLTAMGCAVALGVLTACSAGDGSGDVAEESVVGFAPNVTATRASLTTSIGSSNTFNAIAYYNTNTTLINDETVSKSSGYWRTSTQHFWPVGVSTLKAVYAYMPVSVSGRTITKTAGSAPVFSYTVPTSPDSQVDLLTAVTTNVAKANGTSIPLTFGHILSGIWFSVGSNSKSGTIKSITITGVKNVGSYTFGSTAWTNTSGSVSITKTVNYTSDGTSGAPILAKTNPILVIPQTLPSTSKISIVFNDGSDHTITATPSTLEIGYGKLVEYKLSVTSLYNLTVSASLTNWGSGGTTSVTALTR